MVSSMDVQSHSPMEFHLCDFWCVIVCPDVRAPPQDAKDELLLLLLVISYLIVAISY